MTDRERLYQQLEVELLPKIYGFCRAMDRGMLSTPDSPWLSLICL